MSLRGAAAVVGVAERPPQRFTGDETILELLSGVANDAIADAGFKHAGLMTTTSEQGRLVISVTTTPEQVFKISMIIS